LPLDADAAEMLVNTIMPFGAQLHPDFLDRMA
jgi:hypothetical protein